MNALKGAGGLLLIQWSYWLCPPNQDPQFMALPWTLQFSIMAFLLLMMGGGIILFAWGMCPDAPSTNEPPQA